MAHSFIAYIDESGDDGLSHFRQLGQRGGASCWLNISCSVTRYTNDLETVTWRDSIAKIRPLAKKRSIHFADFNHSQRLAATQIYSKLPIRLLNVMSNKTTIEAGTYSEPNQLYFYLTRYLIERLSWLCRDMRPQVPEGNGLVKIVFSRRGGLSTVGFKEYLELLKRTNDPSIKIHWPVIDIDVIDAKDHSACAGLQLADIGASAIAAGLELDQFGNNEPRYGATVKPLVYCRNGNYFSYGLKIVPKPESMALSDQQILFLGQFSSGQSPGP
jgi:Protein of unknown function (DUF3800)